MKLPSLEIVRSESKRGARRGRRKAKGRRFAVRLLGYLAADSLWEWGRSDSVIRPVWIAFFGGEQESRAFFANFRAGRKAKTRSEQLQVPKSAAYRWTHQPVADGLLTVGYAPAVLELEPVQAVEESVSFVMAPPSWWVAEQARELEPEFGAEAAEVARAALFAAYLDRRTPLPLVRDLRFHLQLYRAASESTWLHEPTGTAWRRGFLFGESLATAGLDSPRACCLPQAALSEFLIEQTALYHQEVLRNGPSPVPTDRWLLPDPVPAAAQLCLDFALA